MAPKQPTSQAEIDAVARELAALKRGITPAAYLAGLEAERDMARLALSQVTELHDKLVDELKVQYRDAERHGWLPPAVELRLRKVIARSRGRTVLDDDDDRGSDLDAVERILDKAARKRATLHGSGTNPEPLSGAPKGTDE